MNEWIADRQPERPGTYLAVHLCRSTNHPWTLSDIGIHYFYGSDIWHDDDGRCDVPYAWCAIPEPPPCPQPRNFSRLQELRSRYQQAAEELEQWANELRQEEINQEMA